MTSFPDEIRASESCWTDERAARLGRTTGNEWNEMENPIQPLEPTSGAKSLRAERRERESAMRRADVITAASSIFAAKGFQGAQVAEIAAAAELSTRSLYLLFASKEEIYQEVIRSASEAVRDKVQVQVDAIDDPKEQLLTLIDSLFACFDEHADLLRLFADSTQGLPWKVRQTLGEPSLHIFEQFTSWVIDIAESAQQQGYLGALDPEAVAIAITGTINTSAARWVEASDKGAVSDAAPAVRAIFERVLGPGPSK
jgi:AcrR family transcriptional regulator